MPDLHDDLIALIAEAASNETMSFDDKSVRLGAFFAALNDVELLDLLSTSGFIPEAYDHDSSEEKVYAKAMDHAVAETLSRIGFDAAVGSERSNAADVIASLTKNSAESLVLDAKAFRISRTALNPKDYKISALSTWRNKSKYACLVAPIAGFPEGNSRLYAEAVSYDVLLLTFSHLAFLLQHRRALGGSLSQLWTASKSLGESGEKSPNATSYWAAIDKVFCEALAVDPAEWKVARQQYFGALLRVADKEIAFYESEKLRIRTLPREELEGLTIQAMKLDGRIAAIRARKSKTEQLVRDVERLEDVTGAP